MIIGHSLWASVAERKGQFRPVDRSHLVVSPWLFTSINV